MVSLLAATSVNRGVARQKSGNTALHRQEWRKGLITSMFIDPQAIKIAVIAIYGALPVPLCIFAYWFACGAATHVWAKRMAMLLPILGISFCFWFFSNFRISKYPQTDFMFGLVLMLWMAALGGILGGAVDRIGGSIRQQSSKDQDDG
jgi:hypothetical protein